MSIISHFLFRDVSCEASELRPLEAINRIGWDPTPCTQGIKGLPGCTRLYSVAGPGNGCGTPDQNWGVDCGPLGLSFMPCDMGSKVQLAPWIPGGGHIHSLPTSSSDSPGPSLLLRRSPRVSVIAKLSQRSEEADFKLSLNHTWVKSAQSTHG